MQWSRSWVVAALMLTLGACGEDERSLASVTQEFCASLCGAWQRCGASDAGCVNRCTSAVSFEHARLDGVELVADCLDREACSTLLGDAPTSPCSDAASDRLVPSATAVSYCEGESKKLFECSIWWSVEDCTKTVSLWTDDVLTDAGRCKEQEACDLYSECVAATFDSYQ